MTPYVSDIRFGLKLAVAGVALMALAGCGSLGNAVGGKAAPDEFAIATKAPLVVPPDFSLRPPKPGESRPQELTTSERARQVLLGDTSAAPPSEGEILLLRKSGAVNADRNIRNILSAENGGRGEKSAGLANQLIFWKFNADGSFDDSVAPLRVDDPQAWMADREEAIKKVLGEDGQVKIGRSKALNLPGVF